MRNALLNCIYIYILYVSRRWRLVRPYIYIVVKRGKNWRFHGRIHDTETLFSQSRNKFARPGKGGSPSLLLQFLPHRVVRFRWCNGSLVSFHRDAAVICHVVGGERLRCICNFTRHSPPPSPSPPFLLDLFPTENTQLRCPSSLPPPPSLSVPFPPFSVSENAPRPATEFEKFWRGEREREGRERRRQTVAKLLGAADDCLRFVPTSPAAPPRICPVK